MRILSIHNDYQLQGGETAIVNAERKLLSSAGHRVVVYQRSNNDIKNFGVIQKITFFPNAIYSLSTYNEVKKIIKEEKIDVAHVHNVFPLISPSVYKALHDGKVPIVQTLHNVRFLCPNGLFYTHGKICEKCKFGNTVHAVMLKCYHNSYPLSALYALSIGIHRSLGTFDFINRYIANTEFTKQKLIESNFTVSEKISILGNYFPSPLPEPIHKKHSDRYIAYIGRLSSEKGVSTLIRAMALKTDVKLKIAGTGPDLHQLHKLVRDLKINHVEFTGHLSGDVKWSFLKQALCTIIPSNWYDTFPLVTLESMAVGTPVIASNIGGLPYIVDDGKNGYLFSPGDYQDLSEKISLLINDPQKIELMGKKCVNDITKKYSEQAHYKKMLEIYAQVFDG